MYKHILIATDGSEIANKGMTHGIDLAKALGATLSAVTVTEPYEAVVVPEARDLVLPADYKQQCEEGAAKILSAVTSAAKVAGVKCDVIHEQKSMAI